MRWCRTPCQRPLRIQPEVLGVEGRGLWSYGWGISGGGLTAQPVSVGSGASAGKWGGQGQVERCSASFPKRLEESKFRGKTWTYCLARESFAREVVSFLSLEVFKYTQAEIWKD